MSEIGMRRCAGWQTSLVAVALMLSASVWAESDVMTGRSQIGMNRTNPSGGSVHNLRAVSQFEGMWDGIKTCNVTFYNPERNEAPEDGRIAKYLRSRGYIVTNTGMGYLRVENLNEMFHGYKVNALTLPDEWGVYGLDIEATLPQVKRLFPFVRFEKRQAILTVNCYSPRWILGVIQSQRCF